jgi:hypothetical protein
MQGDPSRSVNFVWAGSNGQPRGSYAMMQNPDFNSSTFIPSNTISQFYILPGESSFGSVNETATGLLLGADATKFWFEVTEHGHKTVFDQNGAGFPLGETSVLPAEGSCMLIIITEDGNGFSETLSLFVQIGVSHLVSATDLTPGGLIVPVSRLSGHEGCQSLERPCRAPWLPSWQQYRCAGGV